ALGHTPIADFVANRLRLGEALPQESLQTGSIQVIRRVRIAPVLVVVRVRYLEQVSDVPMLYGFAVALAEVDERAVLLRVFDVRIRDQLGSAPQGRAPDQQDHAQQTSTLHFHGLLTLGTPVGIPRRTKVEAPQAANPPPLGPRFAHL